MTTRLAVGVWTVEGREITGLVNDAAARYGFDPVPFVGGAIAESGLRASAWREGVWPDVSGGLFQTAVKWIDPNGGPPGLTRSDGRTVDDTPWNRSIVRVWSTDPANAIAYAAPRYAANLARADGDPQRAWELWNAPSLNWDGPLDPQHAANRENYRRALALAEAQYRGADDGGDPGDVPVAAWHPQDARSSLPRHPEYGDYEKRPYGAVVGATLHYTAGPASQSVRAIADYQTSWNGAQNQTGTGMPFPGIAYHLAVTEDGSVALCHDVDRRVWHSAAKVGGVSRNDTHVGIVFTGTGSPNAAQLDGLARAIVWSEGQVGRRLALEGHRDPGYATACPGPGWPGWRADLQPRVDRFRAAVGGVVVPEPPRDVTGGFNVGSGFVSYLETHPDAGIARSHERWLPDGTGTYIYLTVTERYPSGAFLLWRKLKPHQVILVSWDG